jgi:hypothetical protein
MRITGTITFNEYWNDPRFQVKKPNLRGSKKQAFGDNIYSWYERGKRWCQTNSHHSLTDGSPNESNVRADTSANRVLFSDDFVYWGGFVGRGKVPGSWRHLLLEFDFDQRLDALETVFPRNNHAHGRAVLIWQRFAVHADAE